MPAIQVRSNGLIRYDVWTGESKHTRYDFSECEREPYDGSFTDHARKRLMSAIDILIQRNPTRKIWNPISESEHDFSINFITLTIASDIAIGARQGYDLLLSKWIRYMRDKYGMKEYVWKAELQQRGQIHYHILSNCFIPWQVIRWKWNKVQREAGLLDDWAREHHNFNPNSTDIHVMEKLDNVMDYISKEIGKDGFAGMENGYRVSGVWFDKDTQQYIGNWEDGFMSNNWKYGEWKPNLEMKSWPEKGFGLVKHKLDGRIWDAAERLKMKRFSDIIDDATEKIIAAAIRKGGAKKIGADRCEIIKAKNPLSLLSAETLKNYRQYILN